LHTKRNEVIFSMAAKRRKTTKKASSVTRAPTMPNSRGRCQGSGLEWFVLGVLILANHWAGVAWPVFVGGLVALCGVYKYIKRG
jgi:hypothetical protein